MSIDITRPCPPASALSACALGDHERERLWALTPSQRRQAMWNGALTLFQLTGWSSRTPGEVPLLGREFAWIVMRTPEWDEIADTVLSQQTAQGSTAENVIAFPHQGEHRAAA